MATKKELVKSILDIKEVDTQENLLGKKNSELEEILEELKQEEVKQESVELVTEAIDINALMEKMKAEMLAELKEQARKEVAEETKVETDVSPLDVVSRPTKKKDIDRYEPIPVMNVTNGQLVYVSKKSGAEWNWSQYGDVEYIEFQEILTMKSGQSRFFNEPYLIVLDEDVVDYLGLTKMYDKLVDLNSLDKLLTVDQKSFENVIETSPRGIKLTIIQMLKDHVEANKEVSLKKIKYINEKFNMDIGQRG